MTANRRHRRKAGCRALRTLGRTSAPRPRGRTRSASRETGELRPGRPTPRPSIDSGTGSRRNRRRSRRPNDGPKGKPGDDRDGRAGGCRFRPPPRGPGGGAHGWADARQRGFVTAELAAVLPVVVAVLALSMWAVATVGVKVRVTDAAHSAALAAARGEDPQAAAAAYLPDGASVSVSYDGDIVRTTVTAPSRPLGPLAPAVEVSSDGAAPKEPGLFE